LRVRPIANLTRVLHFASEFTRTQSASGSDMRGKAL
jgi:hypothetical protein